MKQISARDLMILELAEEGRSPWQIGQVVGLATMYVEQILAGLLAQRSEDPERMNALLTQARARPGDFEQVTAARKMAETLAAERDAQRAMRARTASSTANTSGSSSGATTQARGA